MSKTECIGLELYSPHKEIWECVNCFQDGEWMSLPLPWRGDLPKQRHEGMPPDVSEVWFNWTSLWTDFNTGDFWADIVPGKVRLVWFKMGKVK